jgi:hypothetical protein
MKHVTFVGRVSEIYRELPWSAYGREVPKGHRADEKPIRMNVEVTGWLELTAIIAPEAGRDIQLGSIVKVVLGPGTEADVAEFEDVSKAD